MMILLPHLGIAQWTPVHTLPDIPLKLYTVNNSIYAATAFRVYQSVNNGMSWTTLNIPDTIIRDFYVDDEVMMIACPFLYVSYNAGASWIHDTASSSHLNPFSVSRSGNNLLCGTFGSFAGDSAKLYMSVDSGHSWTQQLVTDMYDGFPAFAVKDSFVVASSYAGKLYYSHDYGATYTPKFAPFAFEDAVITNTAIVVGEKTPDIESILYSVNDGTSWQMGKDTVAATDFKSIGDTVFAASLTGFHYSVDGGKTWVTYNAGLPVIAGQPATKNTYAVGAKGNDVWLAHRNGILYHLMLSDLLTDVTNIPTEPSALIYPNPAREKLFISDEARAARVEVFGMCGEKLLDTSYEKNGLDITKLATGMYLVKIYGNRTCYYRKLVIE